MRAADDADLSLFVEASSRRLLRSAYLMTGELAEAEDLLQTALERAYRRWPVIRRKDVPEGWCCATSTTSPRPRPHERSGARSAQ